MKDKILEKWSSIINPIYTTSNTGTSWLEQYTQLHTSNILTNSTIQPFSGTTGDFSNFPNITPIAQRICAKTLGMDLVTVKPMEMSTEPGKSEKQQLRQDRANKIRVIEGNKPDIELPDDIEIPHGVELLYIDFQYGNPSGNTQNNI